MKRYSTSELEALPTISVAQADDLKIDNGDGVRVWLSRVGIADGMPYDNAVSIERYQNGEWVTVDEYPGDEAES